MSVGPVAVDVDGETFAVGDRALHTSNQLDSREVVDVLEENMIALAIGSQVVDVPAENYWRVRG